MVAAVLWSIRDVYVADAPQKSARRDPGRAQPDLGNLTHAQRIRDPKASRANAVAEGIPGAIGTLAEADHLASRLAHNVDEHDLALLALPTARPPVALLAHDPMLMALAQRV
ncbi:MAG: hypothetical protein ACRD0K_12710 [Egibacteraceae bacterium]